jgi:hypothetical protein
VDGRVIGHFLLVMERNVERSTFLSSPRTNTVQGSDSRVKPLGNYHVAMPADTLDVWIAGVCAERERPAHPPDDMRGNKVFEERWRHGDIRYDAGYGYVLITGDRLIAEEGGPVPWGYPSDDVGFTPEPFRFSELLAEVCALFAFVSDVTLTARDVRIFTSSRRLVEYFTGRRSIPGEAHLRDLMIAIGESLNAKRTWRKDNMFYTFRRRASPLERSQKVGPRSVEIVLVSQAHPVAMEIASDVSGEFDDWAWIETFFTNLHGGRISR